MSPSVPLGAPAISPQISPLRPPVQHAAGWLGLHETIAAHLPPGVRIASAKEKFGRLVFCLSGPQPLYTADTNALAAWARDESLCTCEVCGSVDACLRRLSFRARTLCDRCNDADHIWPGA